MTTLLRKAFGVSGEQHIIPLDQVDFIPGLNPSSRMDDIGTVDKPTEKTLELARDIMANGQTDPCVIRREIGGNGCVQITKGHRRTIAIRVANLHLGATIEGIRVVPEPLGTTEDDRDFAILSDTQSLPLSALDEAEVMKRVTARGVSIPEVARRRGCSQNHVRERLRLLESPPEIKAAVSAGKLSPNAAKEAMRGGTEKAKEIAAKSMAGEKVTAKGARAERGASAPIGKVAQRNLAMEIEARLNLLDPQGIHVYNSVSYLCGVLDTMEYGAGRISPAIFHAALKQHGRFDVDEAGEKGKKPVGKRGRK